MKASLNSDGQQFCNYKQSEQSHLISNNLTLKKDLYISVFYCTIQIDIQRVNIISVHMLNVFCSELILYQYRIIQFKWTCIELILFPFFVAQYTCSCIGFI